MRRKNAIFKKFIASRIRIQLVNQSPDQRDPVPWMERRKRGDVAPTTILAGGTGLDYIQSPLLSNKYRVYRDNIYLSVPLSELFCVDNKISKEDVLFSNNASSMKQYPNRESIIN